MGAPPPPAELGVRLASDVLIRDGGRLLAGGTPLRLIRLSAAGARVATAWRGAGGPIGDGPGAGMLARRLLDGGLLDPIPTAMRGDTWRDDVAVVVPVRDRAAMLDRCLGAIGACGAEVVVVDDGSRDPAAVAAVADRHGARIERHALSRGPGAARNTGLAATSAPLVAFVDSDVVVGPGDGWLRELVAHFADPALSAVAPRVLALDARTRGVLAAYERRHASLDMGPVGGVVGPGRPVSYVPAATIVVRRSALPSGGFAEALPLGEDVDLCWRITEAGGIVRYAPDVAVRHDHRLAMRAFVSRRRAYAASIGPLARRHPTALPAWRVDPMMAMPLALLLARRPCLAAAVAALCVVRVRRAVGRVSDEPVRLAAELVARGLLGSAHGAGHAIRRVWSPLLLAIGLVRRQAMLPLVAAYALRAMQPGAPRRPLDVLVSIADDLIAAEGTWEGSLRHGTVVPLLPARAAHLTARRS